VGPHRGAPRFEFADIVRTHRAALESSTHLSAAQRRVLTDIAQCRTAVLGGHLDVCEQCGYEHPSYNSCRNRHCPKCQALAQEKWIAQQQARLVDQPHFHVVFTLPAQLRSLAAFAPTVVYALLFDCAGATLREFGRRRLDAVIGATLVLHTWDKQLRYHPHVHAIVTAGGLRSDGTWIPTRQDFLFPVIAMSRVFRGKMRAALRRAYRAGEFRRFDDFRDPQAFDQLYRRMGRLNWYVYAKRSFARARFVVEYLGRYTHRVALSNSRIVALSGDRVVIRTRGDGRAAMFCTELLRRFVRHVLPKGFHKIRHFGLYASPKLVEHTRRLLPTQHVPVHFAERLRLLTGYDITRCPRCGNRVVSRALPRVRGPPSTRAA
jgi:predicted Zn-ribbon and HTH transcriptional regulator